MFFAQPAYRTCGRSDGERDQRQESEESRRNEGAFCDILHYFRQIEKLVQPDIGREMQACIEKSEQTDQPPELDQPRPARDLAQRSDSQRREQENQRPCAGGQSDELNRVCGQPANRSSLGKARERRQAKHPYDHFQDDYSSFHQSGDWSPFSEERTVCGKGSFLPERCQ